MVFALLLSGVIFVHNPVMFYTAGAEELQFNLTQLCARLLPLFLVALLVCVLPAAVLPRRLADGWVSLGGAVAIFAWLNIRFVVVDFGLLGGSTLDLSTSFGEKVLHFGLLAGLLALVFWLHRRFGEVVEGFALMLTLVLSVSSLWEVWQDDKPAVSLEVDQEELRSLYRFSSTEKNVFIVLMDAFQGDTFAEAVEGDPELRAKLDGFVFFKNAMGVAPTTRMSMPAIYAGMGFAGNEPVDEWSARSRKISFISRLARNGTEVWLTNPAGKRWPRRVNVSPSSFSLLSHPRLERASEAALLVDLSLFRVLPLPLKRYVYNDERWLLKRSLSRDWLTSLSTQDNRLMEVFAERMVAEEAGSAVKFLRLVNTHSPTDIAEDCSYRLSPLSRESYMWQVRCAMSRFGALMDRLREIGVYDNTLVLLIADHGRNLASAFADERSIEDSQWARLAGAANPVFAVKPLAGRGPLRTSDAPVQLTDVGATVCSAMPTCRLSRGRSVFEVGEEESRPRRFISYRWKTEYWKKEHLNDVRAFWVDGPVYRIESWRRELGPEERLEMRPLSFEEKQDSEYLGFGWGGSEEDGGGRWSTRSGATIYMDLPETGELEVVVEVRASEEWHREEMVLSVNGQRVGAHPIPSDQWSRLAYLVPETARQRGAETLIFTFPSANTEERQSRPVLFRDLRVREVATSSTRWG